MAWSTRQRWTLYAVAGLLTGAAMLAAPPAEPDAAATPAVRPMQRTERTQLAVPQAPAVLTLPQRPYGGAGRNPFGEPAALAAAEAAAAARLAPPAPPPAPLSSAPPPVPAQQPPAFGFLGRWTENGRTTVFLSLDGRQLAAVAGQPLTPDYRVEQVDTHALRLRHVPSGTPHVLALVAGPSTAAATAAPGPAAPTESEEQN
jgi:hypothetical protein